MTSEMHGRDSIDTLELMNEANCRTPKDTGSTDVAMEGTSEFLHVKAWRVTAAIVLN